MAALLVGARLGVQSSWALPAALMALTGFGAGFFNTPNQTAIIASVPREYRGFATGMVQTMFGVGSLLGISLASVLLTVMFRVYSGLPNATPETGNPVAFVASINVICLCCAVLMLVALIASFMRGGRRIGEPSP